MVTKILVTTVINTTIELVILVLDMVCLYDVWLVNHRET